MVTQYFSLEQIRQIEISDSFDCPFEIKELIDNLNKQIVPIVLDKQSEPLKKSHQNTSSTHHHQPPRKSRQGIKCQGSQGPGQSQQGDDQQSWERIREFKATLIGTAKSGPEKLIQDIRSALNKMSAKNYEIQKDQIITLLKNNEGEINFEVSKTIFDIASTNRFYAEIYAKLYKELIINHPVFSELLNNFIVEFVSNVREIEHVDGDKDYELFCAYNKRNDIRKAMTVFLVYLMKEEVLSKIRLVNIIIVFQELTAKYLDEPDRVNEVDEITEVLFLFFQEGKDHFQDTQSEWIWKFKVIPMVTQISKYKKKDKPSISSRTIFKYMDMVELFSK